MTDQGRPQGADRTSRPAGYRGALAERDDRLAKPWVVTVIVIFLLMLVLAFAGLPSRLLEEPVQPVPSVAPSLSAAPSPS